MRHRIIAFVLVLCALSATLHAQEAPFLDNSGNMKLNDIPQSPNANNGTLVSDIIASGGYAFNPATGADGEVNCITVQADGKILLAGGFTNISGVARNSLARLNSDGTLDSTFDVGSGANSTIFAQALQADGKVIIGGLFTSYNGTSCNYIARVNPDGSLDTTFAPVSGANNIVWAIAVDSAGKILIGGDFTTYDGGTTHKIARLNIDGTLDVSFDSSTGADSSVLAIAVQSDGKILLGGGFSSYDGTTRNCIARVSSTGALDAGFDPGTGSDAAIRSVALQGDGQVLIGGDFTVYNGTARARVARLNSDGTLDTSFDPGTGIGGSIGGYAGFFGIFLQTDGKPIIYGNFSSYNGISRKGITRANQDGTLDASFNPGSGTNETVRTVAIQPDGRVLIGGTFSSVNSLSHNKIARLRSDGLAEGATRILDRDASDSKGLAVTASDNSNGTWQFSTNGGNSWINFGAVSDSSATLLASDSFTRVRFMPNLGFIGTVSNGITFRAWDRTFGQNGDMNVNVSTNGGSTAFSSQTETASINVLQNSAPVLDSSGNTHFHDILEDQSPNTGNLVSELLASSGTPFDTGTGIGFATVGINEMAVQSDGKVILGGGFSTFNGISRNGIVRLNTDGSVDSSFNPGAGFAAAPAVPPNPPNMMSINALAVQNDGKIVVGGSFGRFNNQTRNNLIRLNADGTEDTSFALGNGADNTVNAIVIQSDQKVVIGGAFASINGQNVSRIARLNSSGSLDLGYSATVDNFINSLALQSDGMIIAAGNFNNANSTSRNAIARFQTNGSLDVTFAPNLGPAGVVSKVVLQNDGKLLVVGGMASFSRLNSNGSNDPSFACTLTFGATSGNAAAIGVQGDGKLMLAGGFDAINGVSRNRLGRVTSNGNVDLSFDPGSGPDSSPSALKLLSDGRIVIAGAFSNYNGKTRKNVARLLSTGSLEEFLSDPDTNAMQGIAVSSIDNTHGAWQFSTDGTNWTPFGAVSNSSATLLASDANTRVRFVPNADYNGSSSISFRAWDQTSGSNAQTGVNLSANGGSTAFSSTTETAGINILAVNDPPSFTKGQDITVAETKTPFSLSNWATNFVFGPPDEQATQAVQQFNVTLPTAPVNGKAPSTYFSVPPAIDTTGKLTFTPANTVNIPTTITVSVSMQDNGGNTLPNTNGSVTPGPTPVITSSTFATAAVGQAFSYTITAAANPLPTLYTASPLPAGLTINFGTISGTPQNSGSFDINISASNGSVGSATLHLTVLPAGSNPRLDTSATQTFTITLTPVADSLVVQTTDDYVQNSLRDCMLRARRSDTITFDPDVFDLSNSDAATVINLGEPLPDMDQSGVTINGSDRRVTLNGSGAGPSSGLSITSNDNVVKGLSIVGFTQNGISISNAANNVIGGDRSLPANGAGPNGEGVRIANCGAFGIQITGTSTANTVKGCWVGLDASGTAAQQNLAGILLQGGAHDNVIGSLNASEANAVGGNGFEGITISGAGTDNNQIFGNIVGASGVLTAVGGRAVAASRDEILGRVAVGNGSAGVFLSKGTQGSTVGAHASDDDLTAANRSNNISNNGGSGVEVRALTSQNNSARSNSISRNNAGGIALFDGSNKGIKPPRFDSVDRIPGRNRAVAGVHIVGGSDSDGRVEVFNDPGDQGAVLVGRADSINGRWTLDIDVSDVDNITATLTDASGNTSPFAVFGRAPADTTPVITSAPTANADAGKDFSYQITATNSPTSFDATGLPAGLSIDTTTGLITGKPTTGGAFTVTLSASNSFGSGTAPLTLTISGGVGAPVILSAATASGTTGQPFFYGINASGSTPMTFSAAPLPAGLSLSGSLISGTPQTVGSFKITLAASNDYGTSTADMTLTVTEGAASTPVAVDSDGDGVSDALEKLAGTDPANSADTPHDQGAVTVDKLQISLIPTATGRDSLKATLRLSLPPGFTPGGSTVAIQFGDAPASLTIDDKGKSPPAPVTVKMTSSRTGDGVLLTLSEKSQTLSAAMQSSGLTDVTTSKAGISLTIPAAVAIVTNGQHFVYIGSVTVNYKAVQGKTGKAKK